MADAQTTAREGVCGKQYAGNLRSGQWLCSMPSGHELSTDAQERPHHLDGLYWHDDRPAPPVAEVPSGDKVLPGESKRIKQMKRDWDDMQHQLLDYKAKYEAAQRTIKELKGNQ